MIIPNEMPDTEILAALRAGSARRDMAWEYMYKRWRNDWINKIRSKGGSAAEAHDALIDGFAAFEKTVTDPGFQLEKSLKGYLTICIYHQWTRNKGEGPLMEEFEDRHVKVFLESVEQNIVKQEISALLDELLATFGERCQKILTMFNEKYSMEEIAKALGFQGGGERAKKEKYKCLKKMKDYLELHPSLKERLRER